MNQWIQMHIKPQNVLVRRAEVEETILRGGREILVRAGNYIVQDEEGTLWQCTEEALNHCYAPGRMEDARLFD